MELDFRVKCPLFLTDFKQYFIRQCRLLDNILFINRFKHNSLVKTAKKFCPVEAMLFHIDRQTYMTRLLGASAIFVKAQEKGFVE
jgi:hypothetical protein